MSDIQKFTCNIGTRKFSRKYNLKIHIRSKHDHSDLNFSCYLCRKNFKNQATYLDHIDQHKESLSFVLYKKAFDKTIIIYRKKLNLIESGISQDNHKNPFSSAVDLYGNTGGSQSGTNFTMPLRNADGMFLDNSDNGFYVVIRYKGNPAPVTSISTSTS